MSTLYCRLCANLTPEYDLIDILGNKNGLELKIYQCLQLEINETDQLPKQTCIECENKVLLYYNFQEQVNKAQQQLLKLEFKPCNNEDITEHKQVINNDEFDENLFLKTELNYPQSIDEENSANDDYDLNDEKSNVIKNEKLISEPKQARKLRGHYKKSIKTIEESSAEIETLKNNFYSKLAALDVKNNLEIISDEQYQEILEELQDNSASKWSDRFEIHIDHDQVKKLVARRVKNMQRIKIYAAKSELFELIRQAHLQTNHGSRVRTENVLKTQFKNITRDFIAIYINLCTVCKYKRRKRSENDSSGVGDELNILQKKLKSATTLLDSFKVSTYQWKCKECNDILQSAKDLNNHFEQIHQKPVEYICTECSKVYDSYVPFRNHLLQHRNRFRFRCEVCNNFYSSARKLRNHKERHNKVRQKYFCATCGKGFLNESYLSIHERRKHSGAVEEETTTKEIVKPYECDVCHKMFASTSSLNNHKKVHVGIREHTCEHCGKSFIYKKYLDDHITSHSAERPFKCEICPASFKAKMYLRRHLYLHSGVRPYQCDVCGKKFPRKPALTEHSITHTDLYPFKCEICDKGFRSKKNVVWHQRLHTGEKPYSCLMCNRHFTCSSNYDKHMKRHHGVVKIKKEFKYLK